MTARTRIASDIDIAAFCLGGNVFGWTADREASFEVLDAYTEGGGEFIDTADGYSAWVPGHSGGESETVIGEWLAARGNRDRVVIATKVSMHPDFAGLAGPNVLAAAEASLARLGTDRIDLYYAHFDDPETPLEETASAFSQLVDEGKIRHIGVSNYTADRIAEWFRIAREAGLHLPVALQPHYNLIERGYERNGLREIAERERLAVFPYYSLAKGFLAGKYRDPSDASAPGASVHAARGVALLDERGRAVLAALDTIADARGVEVAAVSLAWLRQQPTISGPLASATRAQQVEPMLASLSLELSDDELGALSDASA